MGIAKAKAKAGNRLLVGALLAVLAVSGGATAAYARTGRQDVAERKATKVYLSKLVLTEADGDQYRIGIDGVVYEVDSGRLEAERDMKFENGVLYELEHGTWEREDDVTASTGSEGWAMVEQDHGDGDRYDDDDWDDDRWDDDRWDDDRYLGTVSLVAMTSLAPAMAIARNTAIVLGCALSLLLVLVGAYAWTMTSRTLRPVERMRLEVESITAGELGRRVTTPADDPDLAALAVTFNGLLSRVESALKEQRRFVSDASHELKSPIAATGLMLETLRRCPEGLEDEQVVSDLTYENERLSRIVGDLLTLARSDEGRLVVRREPTDLYDVVLEETGALRRRVPVAVDDSEVRPVIGLSDADHLAHVLRNLLDNAARHARSAVYVGCAEVDGDAMLTVSDDGPGIPAEDRERVFGRFVRLDQGRPGSDGGTGLGLAVTREIVQNLGGTVCFGEPLHGGATAIVRLPLD